MLNPNVSYSKDLRLSKSIQYQAVYQEKKKLVTTSLIFYIKKNALNHPRLGLSVSKRYIKRAVNRNRIKRINREHFRFNKNKLDSFDIVVVAKKGIEEISDKELFDKLGRQWNYFINVFKKL